MAPKPTRFVFAVGMALTILAAMTWAMAEPSPSLYPIYQPQLPLLYYRGRLGCCLQKRLDGQPPGGVGCGRGNEVE